MFNENLFMTDLRAELEAKADAEHREGSRAFFKDEINPLGVRSRDLNAIVAARWTQLRRIESSALLRLCNHLWASEVFEEPVLASKWLARAVPRLGEHIGAAFDDCEVWLDARISNWAHCDTLCSGCIGALIKDKPDLLDRAFRWSDSPNRWMRRGAAVSLVPLARRGSHFDTALLLADRLMPDADDMVRKGVGWLLREASRTRMPDVLRFVLDRRAAMPRVTLRCAIELMPPDWRKKAMQKV